MEAVVRRIPLKPLADQVTKTARSIRRQRPASGMSPDRQPFDLAKMQLEPIRRHKRQQLLRRSLPVVLLMAVVALWFLLPTPLTSHAIANYKRQSYRTARRWLTPLTWTSPQPFVIAFNSGTVDTQLGNYTRAQTELTRALALAPADKRCMVLQNLVISLTAHASNLNLQNRAQQATNYSTEATTLKTNNPKCFHVVKKPTPPPIKETQGGGGGGGAQGQSQQVLTSAQQQELQQKDQSGQQSQQQAYKQNTVNPNSPDNQPW